MPSMNRYSPDQRGGDVLAGCRVSSSLGGQLSPDEALHHLSQPSGAIPSRWASAGDVPSAAELALTQASARRGMTGLTALAGAELEPRPSLRPGVSEGAAAIFIPQRETRGWPVAPCLATRLALRATQSLNTAA
jgi:hypothetical protein